MTAFMEFLSSNELTIIICLMVVIFVLIMSIIIIDMFSKQKNSVSLKRDKEKEADDINIKPSQESFGMIADEEAIKNIDISNVNKNLERTQEIEEIKYVEDDEELEKTKALLELETLKKELAKMEEAKANNGVQTITEESIPVQEVEKEEPVVEILETIDAPLPSVEKMEATKKAQVPEMKIEPKIEESPVVPTIEDEVNTFEMEQEENAIISVEELTKASMTITDEEIEKYEDDGNEPISLKELEEMYKSVEEEERKPQVQVQEEKYIPSFELKAKPKEEVYDDKNFKTTPVISPVFGMKPTESSILLEQTANLDKLNEEIRKTNEFLSALKELRKNLE